MLLLIENQHRGPWPSATVHVITLTRLTLHNYLPFPSGLSVGSQRKSGYQSGYRNNGTRTRWHSLTRRSATPKPQHQSHQADRWRRALSRSPPDRLEALALPLPDRRQREPLRSGRIPGAGLGGSARPARRSTATGEARHPPLAQPAGRTGWRHMQRTPTPSRRSHGSGSSKRRSHWTPYYSRQVDALPGSRCVPARGRTPHPIGDGGAPVGNREADREARR